VAGKKPPPVMLRKPSPAPPVGADAFVSGAPAAVAASVQTSERPAPQATIAEPSSPVQVSEPATVATPLEASAAVPVASASGVQTSERSGVQTSVDSASPTPPSTTPPEVGPTVQTLERPSAEALERPSVEALERSEVQAVKRPDVLASKAPDVQASKPLPPASAAPARGRGLVTRADGTERRRTTVYLPPALVRRLKHYCDDEEVEMSKVVSEAVAALLDARGA
jgi:hypothetical protein